jgi:simple sugar transport system permease protein
MSVGTIAAAPPRALAPKPVGWAGVALAILAWFITLPPALVRSPALPIVMAVAAVCAGAWSFVGGEKRLGVGAIGGGILAGVLAVAATKSGVHNLRDVFTWSALIAAMLRFATPLLFAALGGIVSERSGVINIGLEGMMLMGAFFGIWGADVLGSWVLGIVVAMVAGGLLALVHAIFSIALRADQVVSGTAVNFLALGITGYFFIAHYGNNGTPDNVSSVPDVNLPVIKKIGFVGDAIGHANLLTWIGLLAVPALTFFLFRTSWGLRLRAVGE